METFSSVTRFCLICNYVSRIIEPLASRCAKFRFKPLDNETIGLRIKDICEQENVKLSDQVIEEIIKLSNGDLRRSISLAQSISSLYGSQHITLQQIHDVAGVIPPSVLESLLISCRSNSYDSLQAAVLDFISSGYSVSQFLLQLNEKIVQWNELNNQQKVKLALELAKTDSCLVDGADEFLQLFRLCSVIMNVLCSS